MNVDYKDRSEFLRGFLILIKKDNMILQDEKNMFMVIGKHFGFAKDFCEEIIKYIWQNENISEEVPHFSNIEVAEFFLITCYAIMENIKILNEDEKSGL